MFVSIVKWNIYGEKNGNIYFSVYLFFSKFIKLNNKILFDCILYKKKIYIFVIIKVL